MTTGRRLVGDAVEQLEDVVEGVGEPDQLLDAALGELLVGALLELDAGLGQVLAGLLEGRVVGQLPAHAGELVGLRREDHEPGGDLVDPVVQVVRVRAASLGEPEHLAGELPPLLEVGAGDPGVAHAADVDGHALLLPSTCRARKAVATSRNSSAASIWAQWPQLGNTCSERLRDQLQRDQRAVERVDPVLAAPGEQRVLAQPVGLAPEHAVLVGVGLPERRAHRGHRLARAGGGGVGEPLLDELVGDQVLVDHHRGDERPQRLARRGSAAKSISRWTPSVGSAWKRLSEAPPGPISTSRATRFGCSSASRIAVPPPRLLPSRCTRSMPSSSSSWTTWSAAKR